jgi:uncharacterized protein YndB with AHSA1/START domain
MTPARTRHGSAVVTLPSDREIVITRVFDAPPDLVFKAWTTPELVRRWWGHESSPLVVCDIDLRPGGGWRYVTREPDGTSLAWHGTYLEVDAPERLVSTEVFEPHPEGEAQSTLALARHDATTVLTITVVHQSKANRDGHVASGMEGGLQISLNRIEELLAQLKIEVVS